MTQNSADFEQERQVLTSLRHPEVLGAQRRASKGDGPGRSSFEARRHSASKMRVYALVAARTSG
jgi:hypothetical protein